MFKGLRESLRRTRTSVFGQIVSILGAGEINDDTWEDLETLLIQADVGVPTTLRIVGELRERSEREGIFRAEELLALFKTVLLETLHGTTESAVDQPRQLTVVLVVGVNGSGKTTSIGKLAKHYKDKGRKVLMVAGDTFRAAAIDQLEIWAERAGVPIVAGQPGGDPGAIAYDGIRAARARGYDLVLIDTAGRLHTKFNLMRELEKTYNVCRKNVHGAPHEVLLVVDAPTGQNALVQARKFKESVGVSGVILSKLDSTARGGMIFAIGEELDLPVRFIGTGEGIDDLAEFDPEAFVDGLFDKE